MRTPDFLIIGAMKCGTSTLQAQLAAQRGIFMTTPKEPNYFSDDAAYARGEAWYSGLFDGAAPGDLTGEASTHYTKLPTYPETLDRMAACLGNPRFIYLMRDPLDRAISHYIHDWSQGLLPGDPAAAFETTPELAAYSCYGMQLAPYVARYGAASILLVRLEQMQADPHGTLARVGRFLGRSGLVWDASLGPRNVSAERVRRLPLHGLIIDHPVAKTLRRSLVPQSLRTRIRQARQMRHRPDLPETLRARLRGLFAEDQARLAELFPGDPATVFGEPQ